jgi:hypothetical protein
MSRVLSAAVACCLVGMIVVGCGPKGPELGSVTGKVTLDGSPVTNGLVTFVPVGGGRPATGKTDENGQYVLVGVDGKGALLGQHQVSVTTVQEAGTVTEMRSDSPEYAKQAMPDASDYNTAKVVEPIPARYNTNTELSFEVKAGSNVIDLELKSE